MKKTLAGMLVAMVCTAGCTNYYQVHDPTTGKNYYTTELRQMDSGATTLKDARTGNEVSVQNSEVKKISKEEFESGKFTPQTGTMSGYPMSGHQMSGQPMNGQPMNGQPTNAQPMTGQPSGQPMSPPSTAPSR